MGYGRQFDFAVRRLMDSQMRMVRSAHPVYIRLRNFPEVQNEIFGQLGFSYAPSGTDEIGTEDVLVLPPPSVGDVSVHNIGQSMGKLRFGAKTFLISQTFVETQMKLRSLKDEALVWRNSDVVGLVTDGLLFSIEDIRHDHVAGKTVAWMLTCNMVELK